MARISPKCRGNSSTCPKRQHFRSGDSTNNQQFEVGTDNFNQNMEALKQNFLFRRYFKRLEKKE
jgi:hypothetical protein